MAYSPDDYRTYPGARQSATAASVMDAGLRAYMLRVYNWMASGLVLTGIVAWFVAHTPAIQQALYPTVMTQYGAATHTSALGLLVMIAPLGFVLVLSFGVNKLSTTTAQTLYWVFAAVMGASLSSIFLVYAEAEIARVFFISAGTFAAMSLWGYSTRRDLSRWGSFLIMGLIGVIIASVVNIFIRSSGLEFLVSIVGVLVFVGLTAYDTQRIKTTYVQYAYADGNEMAAKRSVYDALSLYLNFINLFLLMLQLFGNRR